MAWTATTLLWGLIEFPNGYGDLKWKARQSVKWALDYFIKAHVSKDVLYGQVSRTKFVHLRLLLNDLKY